MEALKYFVGKICTILTRPLNRDFKEENPQNYREQICQYFLGKVLSIDSHGVLVEQILTPERLRSYFFFHSVVGLCEEQALEANTPENEELLNKIRETYEENQKKAEAAMKSAVEVSPTKDGPIVLGEMSPEGNFINTAALTGLAEQMKQKFNK